PENPPRDQEAPHAPAPAATPDEPTFADLDLPAPLRAAVDELGFVTPSAIQARAIPELLAGRDITGVPQTGTGKTAALGLPLPAPTQPRAIPRLLAGRALPAVAQTGTGKPAAFGLPLLAAVDPTLRKVQALVLTPTRELAMQVADAIESFAAQMDDVRV